MVYSHHSDGLSKWSWRNWYWMGLQTSKLWYQRDCKQRQTNAGWLRSPPNGKNSSIYWYFIFAKQILFYTYKINSYLSRSAYYWNIWIGLSNFVEELYFIVGMGLGKFNLQQKIGLHIFFNYLRGLFIQSDCKSSQLQASKGSYDVAVK